MNIGKLKFLAGAAALAACGTALAAPVYKTDEASLDLGGRMQTNLNSVEASRDRDKAQLEGKARLRVNAGAKITDWVKAIAFTEWEVAAQNSQNGKFNTRFAYLGFKSDDYGSLLFGQNHTGIYYVIDRTDVFIDYGSRGSTYWDFGGRQEGQLQYAYDKNGIHVGAAWQSAGLDGVNGGASGSVGYTFDTALPFTVTGGYDYYDIEGTEDDKQSFAVGASLGTEGDGFYSGFFYQLTDYDCSENKDGWEFIASYAWESGWYLIAGYQDLRQDSAVLRSNLIGELQYNFNSNFKVFLETEIGVDDIDRVDAFGHKSGTTGERSDDKVSLAAQYNF